MDMKEKWSDMTRVLKPIIDKCDCCLKPNELNDLIELLKRGEKYEKIVNEVDTYFSRKYIQNDEWYISEVSKAIKYTIQKYFPREK